ncbi:MAG TPA: thermonuclease family protein [Rhizobiales bacterium]|nr:thermonuclease family protein [Hyphomicrobiales bacterium]
MIRRLAGFRLPRAVLAVCLASGPAAAGEHLFAGPVEARVISVIDGDTLRAAAQVWPGQEITVDVRIRGIDAPEMKGRCGAERRAALAARAALEAMVGPGAVHLRAIGGGKYYGRVVADVEAADGTAVAAALLSLDLVRPYAGGRRAPWCG